MGLVKRIGDSLKRLTTFPSQAGFEFFIRHPKTILIAATSLMMGIIMLLGWLSAKEVKEVVSKDFNQQQLVLAQHAAGQVENSLSILKKELSLLSLSPVIQYFERVSLAQRMSITYSRIRDEGTLEIRYIDTASRTHLVDAKGYRVVRTDLEDTVYLQSARQNTEKGKLLTGEVLPTIPESGSPKLTMKMAFPVWQVSVDETNPVATNKFSGVLIFVVDTTALVEKITRGIRSGKTGYAWVIDSKGTFLYHPESEFIGKNAFEARKEKKPTISFSRINEIQKKMILGGEKGTSWYISGWHKGKEGEMKKLIAYTPIRLTEPGGPLWSVAVVAPISEVEDAIHSIQVRQILLQVIIAVATLIGGFTIFSLIMNWSYSLKREVEKQTIELKQSQQRYKSLVENAEDIIFTVDHNGNYLSINKYGAKLFERRPDEILGHNISDIIACSADPVLTAVFSVFATRRATQITHQIKIGEQDYWFNTNFRRLMDKEGNIYAVLGISRDITDRKTMEEHSYHTEKLASMGTLAAGVAHEINNPLTIILGFTDLLKEKVSPDSEFYDILKTIENQGMKAKRVVENLLTFARHKEHTENEVDINKDIQEVLAVVGNNLLLHKIAITALELSDGLPAVKGDPDELQQVFLNIISNAVYAMRGGGVLTILTRAVNEDSNVEIQIADTGSGIKKEYRSRIFDPLFTTKKVGDGTGLGLSVSYGIIARHGGTITFETKTEEESTETGTSFIITLPAIKRGSRVGSVPA